MATDFYIVTGASDNHFKSLMQFLSSVKSYPCIVYDLGLSEHNIQKLKSMNITYRLFDYSKYPTYYNIHINAGEYAWKPAVIKTAMDELLAKQDCTNTILLWCDAGDIAPYDLTPLRSHIESNKLFSPTSLGTIRKWTYPDTLKWFSISPTDSLLNNPCRNGAMIGFHIGCPDIQTFIRQFDECAGIRECIAPAGSSRANHRQDQAVLTILYYQFMKTHPTYSISDHYYGIRIHCDCD